VCFAILGCVQRALGGWAPIQWRLSVLVVRFAKQSSDKGDVRQEFFVGSVLHRMGYAALVVFRMYAGVVWRQTVRREIAEFDVRDYGAAYGGKALDSPAIQKAIDGAASHGAQGLNSP
jgi:hypothetical protein